MLARRLLILLAVLMGLTALASGVAPRQPVPRSGAGSSPSTTATESLPAIEEIVDAAAAEPARIVVDEGRTLVLEVRSAELDSVSLEGLDRIEAVDPDSPARFELLAEPPGSYPIQLVDAGRELGTLEIRDAG
jgi:hypothetical protein